jgi:hypothetical protein
LSLPDLPLPIFIAATVVPPPSTGPLFTLTVVQSDLFHSLPLSQLVWNLHKLIKLMIIVKDGFASHHYMVVINWFCGKEKNLWQFHSTSGKNSKS